MRKKILVLIMCAVLGAGTITGCGGGSKEEVSVTLTSEFFEEGATNEEIEKAAKESGVKEVTFGDDGTITYTMDKDTQKKMLEELKKNVDDGISSILNGEQGATSIKEITYNDDMTEFTFKCDGATYSEAENMYALAFYISGGMYQLFNGVKDEDVNMIIKMVDAESGDVLNEIDTKDLE